MGKHFWVLSLSPRQENDGENDPSLSPAHLPQIPGKRIWQPHAHHQTPALTLLHSCSHLASCLFSCKHLHTQTYTKPQKSFPTSQECVWAYIRHQDPLGWHQTQTHRGTPAAVPHLGRWMCVPVLGKLLWIYSFQTTDKMYLITLEFGPVSK